MKIDVTFSAVLSSYKYDLSKLPAEKTGKIISLINDDDCEWREVLEDEIRNDFINTLSNSKGLSDIIVGYGEEHDPDQIMDMELDMSSEEFLEFIESTYSCCQLTQAKIANPNFCATCGKKLTTNTNEDDKCDLR